MPERPAVIALDLPASTRRRPRFGIMHRLASRTSSVRPGASMKSDTERGGMPVPGGSLQTEAARSCVARSLLEAAIEGLGLARWAGALCVVW